MSQFLPIASLLLLLNCGFPEEKRFHVCNMWEGYEKLQKPRIFREEANCMQATVMPENSGFDKVYFWIEDKVSLLVWIYYHCKLKTGESKTNKQKANHPIPFNLLLPSYTDLHLLFLSLTRYNMQVSFLIWVFFFFNALFLYFCLPEPMYYFIICRKMPLIFVVIKKNICNMTIFHLFLLGLS